MKLTFLTALALAAAGLLGCGGPGGVESEVVSAEDVMAPEPAPDFTLEDSEGREVSLSDYQGKVVLLNFWATWCGPCKIEMPWFVEFQRKYKDQGFSVLAVSLDEEGWDVVKPFIDDMELNFPVLLGDDQMADEFGGIMALPTTLIIDKEGQIVSRHMGLVERAEYEEDIEGLL